MKIAQVAPLFEAVPPKLYGGTERVIHYLTEELVRRKHEVTLFASGDSVTTAQLIPITHEALRLNPDCIDPLAHCIVQLEKVIRQAKEFDIIHFHTDFLHFPFSSRCDTPCITTLHGRLDLPDLQPLYNEFPRQKVISISNSQRLPLPQANWIGTVYHGLPAGLHPLQEGNGEYLAFIGRISPEKGVDWAIQIAIECNCPIKIAAKIDKVDQHYFEKHIAHLIDHPLVEYVGEINEQEKTSFLGKAKALLFPINWSEPFGLVMIEALSCGTPVIAFKNGSVPEVIDHGITGFVVESIPEAVQAVSRIKQLSRPAIRRVFEERFTAGRMAEDYLRLYIQVLQDSHHFRATSFPAPGRNNLPAGAEVQLKKE
ncbi:glycosyltransferase family 4 protein [Pseudoflavitalea sp. X16]|uniref:glycosyltransferase family 4 protein n=1 Tax=Paraflavitalea devenefica TaxID=2716334 RepID=UPI0014222A45|nr:glycosyltransferase family 4 protein [Paraflavitalea devenefica]NII26568.1 glycosyltransferase family 4 protein [Paraflavitalea devenefica]